MSTCGRRAKSAAPSILLVVLIVLSAFIQIAAAQYGHTTPLDSRGRIGRRKWRQRQIVEVDVNLDGQFGSSPIVVVTPEETTTNGASAAIVAPPEERFTSSVSPTRSVIDVPPSLLSVPSSEAAVPSSANVLSSSILTEDSDSLSGIASRSITSAISDAVVSSQSASSPTSTSGSSESQTSVTGATVTSVSNYDSRIYGPGDAETSFASSLATGSSSATPTTSATTTLGSEIQSPSSSPSDSGAEFSTVPPSTSSSTSFDGLQQSQTYSDVVAASTSTGPLPSASASGSDSQQSSPAATTDAPSASLATDSSSTVFSKSILQSCKILLSSFFNLEHFKSFKPFASSLSCSLSSLFPSAHISLASTWRSLSIWPIIFAEARTIPRRPTPRSDFVIVRRQEGSSVPPSGPGTSQGSEQTVSDLPASSLDVLAPLPSVLPSPSGSSQQPELASSSLGVVLGPSSDLPPSSSLQPPTSSASATLPVSSSPPLSSSGASPSRPLGPTFSSQALVPGPSSDMGIPPSSSVLPSDGTTQWGSSTSSDFLAPSPASSSLLPSDTEDLIFSGVFTFTGVSTSSAPPTDTLSGTSPLSSTSHHSEPISTGSPPVPASSLTGSASTSLDNVISASESGIFTDSPSDSQSGAPPVLTPTTSSSGFRLEVSGSIVQPGSSSAWSASVSPFANSTALTRGSSELVQSSWSAIQSSPPVPSPNPSISSSLEISSPPLGSGTLHLSSSAKSGIQSVTSTSTISGSIPEIPASTNTPISSGLLPISVSAGASPSITSVSSSNPFPDYSTFTVSSSSSTLHNPSEVQSDVPPGSVTAPPAVTTTESIVTQTSSSAAVPVQQDSSGVAESRLVPTSSVNDSSFVPPSSSAGSPDQSRTATDSLVPSSSSAYGNPQISLVSASDLPTSSAAPTPPESSGPAVITSSVSSSASPSGSDVVVQPTSSFATPPESSAVVDASSANVLPPSSVSTASSVIQTPPPSSSEADIPPVSSTVASSSSSNSDTVIVPISSTSSITDGEASSTTDGVISSRPTSSSNGSWTPQSQVSSGSGSVTSSSDDYNTVSLIGSVSAPNPSGSGVITFSQSTAPSPTASQWAESSTSSSSFDDAYTPSQTWLIVASSTNSAPQSSQTSYVPTSTTQNGQSTSASLPATASIPSSVPTLIVPANSIANQAQVGTGTQDDPVKDDTLISLLLSQNEYPWLFVVRSSDATSQLFNTFPPLIANALNISVADVKTYGLMVYQPASWDGSEASLLTQWLAYIPQEQFDTLNAYLKASNSPLFNQPGIQGQLAAQINTAYPLAATTGNDSRTTTSGSGPGGGNKKRSIIIGVCVAVGGLLWIGLVFWIYKRVKQSNDKAVHKRLSEHMSMFDGGQHATYGAHDNRLSRAVSIAASDVDDRPSSFYASPLENDPVFRQQQREQERNSVLDSIRTGASLGHESPNYGQSVFGNSWYANPNQPGGVYQPAQRAQNPFEDMAQQSYLSTSGSIGNLQHHVAAQRRSQAVQKGMISNPTLQTHSLEFGREF